MSQQKQQWVFSLFGLWLIGAFVVVIISDDFPLWYALLPVLLPLIGLVLSWAAYQTALGITWLRQRRGR